MRFGVELPEAEADLNPNGWMIASDTLSILIEGEGVCVGVGGADRFFIAECRGGEGGRVEDECRLLVKRRETDAVAVDVACRGVTIGGDRRVGRAGDF